MSSKSVEKDREDSNALRPKAKRLIDGAVSVAIWLALLGAMMFLIDVLFTE